MRWQKYCDGDEKLESFRSFLFSAFRLPQQLQVVALSCVRARINACAHACGKYCETPDIFLSHFHTP